MSLKDADEEHIQIANKSNDISKGKMAAEKISFLKNAGLLLSAREKILNKFKTKIFPTKTLKLEPEPTEITAPKQKERTS